MPEQKPGRSVQEVGTPTEFLLAVEDKLGRDIGWDLAADANNHVVAKWFGPGSPVGEDSFRTTWHLIDRLLWLNPPYANIGDWAKKCAQEGSLGAHVAMLIPAAIGTNYFREWVYPYARVYALSPRLTFVGHTQSYPKDLILCEYGPNVSPGFECWRWKP
jgi:hypothetical protein